MWGGRFSGAADDAAGAFTASVGFDRALAEYDIRGSVAHAKTLAAAGALSDEECAQIVDGLSAIAREIRDGTFPWSQALEDVHMGYEEGKPAVFDRNINGWVQVPEGMQLPDNQQERDMIARELLVKFQMSESHPMVELMEAYRKF